MTFCDEIEVASKPQREAMMRHPFVLGIGDGSLSTERFRHFMTQDYVYLIDYARCLAMGTVKAPDLAMMSWFAGAVDHILNTEMELHRSYCSQLGKVGEMLAEQGEPAHAPQYAEWIRIYAGEESRAVALEARAICDRVAGTAGSQELAAMREAYITCTRYERKFWQMAWDLEEWEV